MFFILRVAFWLTVVLLLLPSTPDSQAPQAGTAAAPRVNAIEALSAAKSAVSDAGDFCSRQPQACAIGREVIGILGERAEAGARLLLTYIGDQISEEKRKVAARAAANPADDTLTAHDLSPDWQAPDPSVVRRGLDAMNSAIIFGQQVLPPAAPPATPAAVPANSAIPTPPKRPS